MKISAVVCSRNDNPNNYVRLVLTLNNLIDLYDEVIYVDYGSVKPIFEEEFFKINVKKSARLRCINVTLDNAKAILSDRFIEVYARNIGIRRATCDFIVSTNQDIICDRPATLDENTLYTVARYNYPIHLVNGLCEIPQYLQELKRVKSSLSRQQDAVDSAGNPIWDSGDRWSLVVSCGDYQIAHKKIWNKIRGFEESMIERCYADSNLMKKASKFFNIKKLDLDVFHLDHPINVSSNYKLNDRIKYVNNFDETLNEDTWGFSTMDFNEIKYV